MKSKNEISNSLNSSNSRIFKSLFFISLIIFGVLFQSYHLQAATASFGKIEKYNNQINVTNYNNLNNGENIMPSAPVVEEIVNKSLSQFDPVGSIVLEELHYLGAPNPFFSYQLFNIPYDEDYRKFDYIETVQPFNTTNAELDKNSGLREGDVWIKINETCRWQYWYNATEWVIGITPSLDRWEGIEMWMNGSKLAEDAADINENGMYYNFSQQFEQSVNGSIIMSFIYKAPLPVTQAKVYTNEKHKGDEILTGLSTKFVRDFNYSVFVGSQYEEVQATGTFKFYLPDYEDLTRVVVYKNGNLSVNNTDNYVIENNIFNQFCNLTNPTEIKASFRSTFTVEITANENNTLYGDKLIEGLSTRQRYYRIQVTAGPATLPLRYFWINDTTIPYYDLLGSNRAKSGLNRPVEVRNMNYSVPKPPVPIDEEEEGNEDIDLTKYVDGISFLGGNDTMGYYYISKGEVDIITITYNAKYFLTAIITDKIATPLIGYKVIVHYQGVRFGPVMKLNGPCVNYPTLTTDRNGQISIDYVPFGNFSLEVINLQGETVGFYNASSNQPNNVVKTDVPHFPIIQIVFMGICLVTLIAGIQIFKKREHLR